MSVIKTSFSFSLLAIALLSFQTYASTAVIPYSKYRHVELKCSGQLNFWPVDNPNIQQAILFDSKDCTVLPIKLSLLDSNDNFPVPLIYFDIGKVSISVTHPFLIGKQPLINRDNQKLLGDVSASITFSTPTNNFNQ